MSKANKNGGHGITISETETLNQEFDIKENYAHKWYFVVANCNEGTGEEQPVQIDSVTLISEQAIKCPTEGSTKDDGGYIAGVIILTLLCASLIAGAAFLYYKVFLGNGSGGSDGRLRATKRWRCDAESGGCTRSE